MHLSPSFTVPLVYLIFATLNPLLTGFIWQGLLVCGGSQRSMKQEVGRIEPQWRTWIWLFEQASRVGNLSSLETSRYCQFPWLITCSLVHLCLFWCNIIIQLSQLIEIVVRGRQQPIEDPIDLNHKEQWNQTTKNKPIAKTGSNEVRPTCLRPRGNQWRDLY